MSLGIEELVLDWMTILAHFIQYGGEVEEKATEMSLMVRMLVSVWMSG
jgi:hypothetical protein